MPDYRVTDTSGWSDIAYQQHILNGVSRTFGLTIPQLPPPLVPVVVNGYLLCRIADTIEDATELDSQQKADFAALFAGTVRGEVDAEAFAAQLFARLGDDTPAAERDLVRHTARVLRITRGFSTSQQQALTRCVIRMLEGMVHFQVRARADGLDDLSSLSSYCYHVAGVVGEMLTDVYCDYCPAMEPHREELMSLSLCFGQGLQLTNILKDNWDDLERGVCWLPRSILRKHGVEPDALLQSRGSAQFGAALNELIAIAHADLRHALRYSLLIPASEAGLRRFCLWSIGLALQTLQRLHKNPAYRTGEDVKVSRSSLTWTLLLTNLCTRWDTPLRLLFALTARGLPAPLSHTLCAADLQVDYRLPEPDESLALPVAGQTHAPVSAGSQDPPQAIALP
jgi:farnesyl-diphosphate farnesyltransferase